MSHFVINKVHICKEISKNLLKIKYLESLASFLPLGTLMTKNKVIGV